MPRKKFLVSTSKTNYLGKNLFSEKNIPICRDLGPNGTHSLSLKPLVTFFASLQSPNTSLSWAR